MYEEQRHDFPATSTLDLASSARTLAVLADDARAHRQPGDVEVLRRALDRVEAELRRRGAHSEVRR